MSYSKVILFYDFLNKNPDLIKKIKKLGKEYSNKKNFIENEIIPIAKENGFNISLQDIYMYENERLQIVQKLNENDLESVAGGIMNNKFITTGLLGIALLSGTYGNFSNVRASGNTTGTNLILNVSESKKTEQTVKENFKINELSAQEKAYFENLLGNKYKIIKQVGLSSFQTSAYLMHDANGNEFVLKIANNPEDKEWVQNQKEALEKTKKITEGWKGNAQVLTDINFGNGFIIEKYLGENLTSKVYENLTPEEKQQVAKDLAEFLAFINKQGSTNDLGSVAYSIHKDKDFSFYDCMDYIKDATTIEQRRYALGTLNKLYEMGREDEYYTNCYEFGAHNVLYNPKTKKLAAINVDCVESGNRYEVFRSGMALSAPELVSKLIDEYNKISDNKINKEKVKLSNMLSVIIRDCQLAKFEYKLDSVADIAEFLYTYAFPNFKKIEKELSDSYNN